MEPRANVSVVQVDNYAGGRIATQHLFEQGYRRIGHVSGPMAWWEARERKRGWRDALTEAGLEAAESQCTAGDWSSASGESAFLQLQEQFPDMQAMFVSNDQMALGAMYAARQRGVRIPEDLAIVGCDAIPEGAYFSPPLTTVLNDTHRVGSVAVTQLHEMIEAGRLEDAAHEHTVISLEPELIVRQSSVAS
jgi:LacI family transcriptional regulator